MIVNETNHNLFQSLYFKLTFFGIWILIGVTIFRNHYKRAGNRRAQGMTGKDKLREDQCNCKIKTMFSHFQSSKILTDTRTLVPAQDSHCSK